MSLIEKLSVSDVKKYNHHFTIKNFIQIVINNAKNVISGQNFQELIDWKSENDSIKKTIEGEKNSDPKAKFNEIVKKRKMGKKTFSISDTIIEDFTAFGIKNDDKAKMYFFPVFESVVNKFLSRGYISSLKDIVNNDFENGLSFVYNTQLSRGANENPIQFKKVMNLESGILTNNKYSLEFFSNQETQHFFYKILIQIFSILELSTNYQSDFDIFLQKANTLYLRTEDVVSHRMNNNSNYMARSLVTFIKNFTSEIFIMRDNTKIPESQYDYNDTEIVRQIKFKNLDTNDITQFKKALESFLTIAQRDNIIKREQGNRFSTNNLDNFMKFIEDFQKKQYETTQTSIYITKFIVDIEKINQDQYEIKLKPFKEILNLFNQPNRNFSSKIKSGLTKIEPEESSIKRIFDSSVGSSQPTKAMEKSLRNKAFNQAVKNSIAEMEMINKFIHLGFNELNPYILILEKDTIYKYDFLTISENKDDIIIILKSNIDIIIELARNIRDYFIDRYNLLAKLKPAIKKEEYDGSRGTFDVSESIRKSLENGKPVAFQRYKKRKKDDPAYLFLTLDTSGSMGGVQNICRFFMILLILFFERNLHKLIIGFIATPVKAKVMFPKIDESEEIYRTFLLSLDIKSIYDLKLKYSTALSRISQNSGGGDIDNQIQRLEQNVDNKYKMVYNQIKRKYEQKYQEIEKITIKRHEIEKEQESLKKEIQNETDIDKQMILRKKYAKNGLIKPSLTYLASEQGDAMLKEFEVNDLEKSVAEFLVSKGGSSTTAYVMEPLVQHKYMNNRGLKYFITITDAELGGGSERKYNPIVKKWIQTGGVGAMQYWLKVAKDRNDTRSMFIKVTGQDENPYEYFSNALGFYNRLTNYYETLSLLDNKVRSNQILQEEMDYQNFLMTEGIGEEYFDSQSKKIIKNIAGFKSDLNNFEYFTWLEKNQDSVMTISYPKLTNPLIFEYMLKKLYEQDFFIL